MFGRAYQWLIMGTYSDQWWSKHEDMRCGCNESDVATSLEAAILTGILYTYYKIYKKLKSIFMLIFFVDLLPLSTTGDITISGIVSIINIQNIL